MGNVILLSPIKKSFPFVLVKNPRQLYEPNTCFSFSLFFWAKTRHMKILMLIGTQTGNTETVAEAVAQHLAVAGHLIHFVDLADAYPEMLMEYPHLILATSTWGDGELPDNALDFYETLLALAPDLSHLQYAILALGDHTYDPYFCKAAEIFQDILHQFGARQSQAPYEIDAGPTKDDIRGACEWAIKVSLAFNGGGPPSA